MTSAKELREEYLRVVEGLPRLDRTGRELAAGYMTQSEAVYQGEVSDFLYVPKMYTARDIERFQEIATTTYTILEKIIQHYVDNPNYRKHFDFPQSLEELILLDPGYGCTIPIIRMDIFYNEDSGDFKFCEFNTDGSSAMNEDREVSNALALTPSFKTFTQNHNLHPFELFDSWVDALLKIYAETADARRSPDKKPNIVIADFLDISTPLELKRFSDYFRARGLQAEVCDIRSLRFNGTTLQTSSGMVVDALYRRAVTGDIMKHLDQVGDFLAAYRAKAFTLIGSFRTQIPHSKLSFEILHLPETRALLTSTEQDFICAHVPHTVRLSPKLSDLISNIINNKHDWIIKPLDSYGSKGVWAGRELDQKSWENLIRKTAATEDHIAQHYVEQFTAPNLESGFILSANKKPVELDGLPSVKEYRDLTGLFVYAGKFKGLLARAGQQDRICAAAAGKTLGTFRHR